MAPRTGTDVDEQLHQARARLVARGFLTPARNRPTAVTVTRGDGRPFAEVAGAHEYTRHFWEHVGFPWSPAGVAPETGGDRSPRLTPTQNEVQDARVRIAAVWAEAGVPVDLARQEADEALRFELFLETDGWWVLP